MSTLSKKRPPRVFQDRLGRLFILLRKKKVYVNTRGLSDKDIIALLLKHVVKRRKRKPKLSKKQHPPISAQTTGSAYDAAQAQHLANDNRFGNLLALIEAKIQAEEAFRPRITGPEIKRMIQEEVKALPAPYQPRLLRERPEEEYERPRPIMIEDITANEELIRRAEEEELKAKTAEEKAEAVERKNRLLEEQKELLERKAEQDSKESKDREQKLEEKLAREAAEKRAATERNKALRESNITHRVKSILTDRKVEEVHLRNYLSTSQILRDAKQGAPSKMTKTTIISIMIPYFVRKIKDGLYSIHGNVLKDALIDDLDQTDLEHIIKDGRYIPRVQEARAKLDSQSAKGDSKGDGLFEDEIDTIMKKYSRYKGTWCIDNFSDVQLTDVDKKKGFGMIVNLDKSTGPGTHWVSLNVTPDSIEYYDSFGKDPSEDFLKELQKLITKISPTIYLKFKVNKIIDQRSNSSNCGWFAIKFLIDRFRGLKFKDVSGFSEVQRSEKRIRDLKQKFGYV